MSEIKRVKIDSIIESQIPEFINEEYPLFVQFLKGYYLSLEVQSGTLDLANNINKYKTIEQFNNDSLISSTTLTTNVLSFDTTINVASTKGWPSKYGLLKINDEIITYTTKTDTSFDGCLRGFSGIDVISSFENSEFLNFSSSSANEHLNDSTVTNLSNLFLIEFFDKFKAEFLPGFEGRDFNESISIENILTSIRTFYASKGTDKSYKLLFKILYGKDIEIIKPQDFTLIPSSNSYFTTKNILVEKISGGNAVDIKGNFLYQYVAGIGTASASIYNVEYRPINQKEFYEISLDSTSFTGNFQVSGKTKILETVPIGSDSILVDSTIGFSESGTIIIQTKNSNFTHIQYTDKTINQFLGVTGVTKELEFGLDVKEEKFAYSYIGVGNTSKVEFRIVNVINDIDVSNTSNLVVGDKIQLSGFGKDLSNKNEFNSWIYNIPTNHNINQINVLSANKFRITLFDFVYFSLGENLYVENQLGERFEANITNINYGDFGQLSNRIDVQVVSSSFDPDFAAKVVKKIYKANHYFGSTNYTDGLTSIPSGIQNTYIDSNQEYFYVTSTGLPNYTLFSTNNQKNISGIGVTTVLRCDNHQFSTGESVYYNPLPEDNSGISTGLYYVTNVGTNYISLSFSKSDIFSKKYIQISNSSEIVGVSSATIIKNGYQNKSLKNQKILKKFNFNKKYSNFDDVNQRSASNRELGLLINGVELLSPTVFDENIFYGELTDIQVTNSGDGYDVINTPTIEIIDSIGSGAKVFPNIVGEVKEIKVLSAGVGYKEKPKITISGGNGTGCVLESNLVKSRISNGFNAQLNVNTIDNTIQFLEKIVFNDNEEVIYNSNNNANVNNLVNGARYFIGIKNQSTNTIQIYNTQNDAIKKISGTEISFIGISSGFHSFQSLKNKNTITEVYVKEPGKGYSNRSIKIPSVLSADNNTVGINTFDSYFFARNHGFNSGEVVNYSTTGSVISGMSTLSSYYIDVIDSNKFRLSVGIGTSISNQNYVDKKYVKFSSLGIGTHTISYPPITIKVESISIGSTTTITPTLVPIVLGKITDVYLENSGSGYGVEDIVNYHRRPDIGISSVKSLVVLKPIVLNGSIVDVKIVSSGKGYRNDSDIIIEGEGNFAEIIPVVSSNGSLSSVNIINGGVGYASSNTTLTLVNRGKSAKFLANVNSWSINQVSKSSNIISSSDDGVLCANKNPNLGLQFINFYIPKKLRYQKLDNFTSNNLEDSSTTLKHSPILGFAYDGNPIYGPYGYKNINGTGGVARMTSSYILSAETDPSIRPQTKPAGYFIKDYIYDGSGNLDQFNGRFCVTPEYPNGIYAYFYTISVDASNNSTPAYPYVVGPYFRDVPIIDNFIPKFNQDLNIFSSQLTRNVSSYYLNSSNSSYDLIDKVSDTFKQEFRVSEIEESGLQGTFIFSPGDNYQINDRLVLNREGTNGSPANIVVSQLSGKSITDYSLISSTITDVNFITKNSTILAKTSSPHSLIDKQPIYITGISTVTSSTLEGIKYISVANKEVELSKDIPIIASTGISTFIVVKDVEGFLINDFIQIGTETLLITDISKENYKFYVNRLQNTGIHTVGIDNVVLLPTKFEFKLDNQVKDITFENTVTFFDPKTTVGTGTAGVTRSIIGIGTSSTEIRFIPTKSIYLPNHKFFTGQSLIYDCGVGGTSLVVNNVGSGVSFKLQKGQTVYAVNLGLNYVGLSTLGFTTSSGIGTQLRSLEFWNLTEAFGVVGYAHSLTTTNAKITGTVSQSIGILTTKTSHGLLSDDKINLQVTTNNTQQVKIIYDTVNRKLLANQILFNNTNVSTINDEIDISSYNYEIKTGDKVVYISSSVIGGLSNYGIYYVLKTNTNKIKLCTYKSDIEISNYINFTSTGGSVQNLYFINPPIKSLVGNKVNFDLSDPSLLDMELEFFYDINFTRKIGILGTVDDGFVVTRSTVFPGTTGSYVTVDFANSYTPTSFYYNLLPKGLVNTDKNQISCDISVLGANNIVSKQNSLNDYYSVTALDDNTFSIQNNKILSYDETYNLSASNFTYSTQSQNAFGPIAKLKINYAGKGYRKVPYVNSIETLSGKNSLVKIVSSIVGKVKTLDRIKDGFDYPTDPTLSPTFSTPAVIGIKDIRTIDYIGIITGGRGYNSNPSLVVKGSSNIQLSCSISGGSVVSVTVDKNATNLREPLEIIPIRNSNGYEIFDISIVGNLVTLELVEDQFIASGFGLTSFVFPFAEGDEIFIENCRLSDSSIQNNYLNFNSSDYNYAYFTVVGVSTYNNTVTYDISEINTSTFGTYETTYNYGTVVNKKDTVSLEMFLNDDVSYLSKEKVFTTNQKFSANVMEDGWDNNLNQLRINNCVGILTSGDILVGENSDINGTIEFFDIFNLNGTLGVSRDKVGLLDNSVGILNDSLQRLSDNFYYQKFAYSIKGEIPYDTWKESVRSIIHPSGFKEFSDLVIYSEPSPGLGKSTSMNLGVGTNTSTTLVNIDSESSMYTRNNFANVYEDELLPDGSIERVYLYKGVALLPYILNKSNKVLLIDDITNQFTGSSEAQGSIVVGLTTFKLTNKGTPLFKHVFDASSSVVNLADNKFNIINHNFQTGQELIYNYGSGTPIGIGSTSYVTGITSTVIQVGSYNGTAIFENGYNVAISTTISGVSTTLSPIGPSSKTYISARGTNGVGIATFNILISYSISTGQPISTSIILTDGGANFAVGDTVSIAGTYIGGITPTNDLSFVVSTTTPTKIPTQANISYSNVPAQSGGAIFNVSRDTNGFISNVSVVTGGSGYNYTSIISIGGTYIGGISPRDTIKVSPSELGTRILPNNLFVYKINDNEFKVSGLSTSTFMSLSSLGTGYHSLEYKNPNPSVLITVDNVIQSPLSRKSLNVSLASSVSTASTTIINISSGISSLNSNDIINIDNEYLLVKTIGISSPDAVEVDRGFLGSVSDTHLVGTSCTVLEGNYNIVGDVIYFTTPPYGSRGPVGLETSSTFAGRIFSRRLDASSLLDKNIILDDISLAFTGVASTEFTILSNGSTTQTLYNDVNSSTQINNNPIILINNVFQVPNTDYIIDGPTQNTIKFISGVPKAGKISKVGLSTNFGYLPLIGAAATVTVSAAGTISKVTLVGPGFGYKTPPSINILSTVGSGASITATVGTSGTITGFVIVNAGSGYTNTSIPEVIIGIPTAYSNIGLAYTMGSTLYFTYDFSRTTSKFDGTTLKFDNYSLDYTNPLMVGTGQGAKVSITVGQGSSVIGFSIDNPGVGYKPGDALVIPGITTNPLVGAAFTSLIITVQEVETDKFFGFYPGQFIRFEDISSQFNGAKKKFDLKVNVNGTIETVSLKTEDGSDLDISNNFMVFVNDILQTPNIAYSIQGSRIVFTEAPKSNSNCSISYYRGSSIDVELVDPPKVLKEGDTVTILENIDDSLDITQFDRGVKKIFTSDSFKTFPYNSIGIDTNNAKIRPLSFKKQRYDKIINGVLYSKQRPDLKSIIKPVATIIKPVTITDTKIYVDNAYPIFTDVDKLSEDLAEILITEDRDIASAYGTCLVSSASTIYSPTITYSGVGYAYTSSPKITFSKSFIKKKDPIYQWNYSSGISTSYQINAVEYQNLFVGIGNSSALITSIDGKNWLSSSVGYGNLNFNSITSVGLGTTSAFVSVGSSATIITSVGYSSTISSWRKISLLEDRSTVGSVSIVASLYSGTFNDIAYGNSYDTFVVVGTGGSIFSGTGINTTSYINRYSTTLNTLNSVAFSSSQTSGYFVAVGTNGTLLSSSNGKVWEADPKFSTTINLRKVIYADGKFVIVGNTATVAISSSRSNYTLLSTNITGNIVNINYNDGVYTALTSTGTLYYSLNLTNWKLRSTNQSNIILDIINVPSLGYEGTYVLVGSSGTSVYATPVYHQATGNAYVSAGIVTSIIISDGGFGYDQSSSPPFIIEQDVFKKETLKSIKAKGDFGTIIGINTFVAGTPGIGTTTPKIEFVLKSDYYDNGLGIGYSSLNTFGVAYPQLEVGDYFIISNSNVSVGHALTGITTTLGGMSNYPNSRVGTAVSFIDGVYKVESVTSPNVSLGIVTVTCNFAPRSATQNFVQVYSRGVNNTGVGTNGFYGRYSWGVIYDYQNRVLGSPQAFVVYNNNGLSGISTSPKVIRTRGLISN